MDEAQSLDALASLLNQLSQTPYDISLHAKHIRQAQSSDNLESQAHSAREMLVVFFAAGEEAWIPLIEAKEKSEDLDSASGIQEVLALYVRAETDYISIPILQKHLDLLIDRHAYFSGPESKPDDLGELFSTEWTRLAIADVVSKGIGHLTQSHLLWDVQRDWELEQLEAAPTEGDLVNHVEVLHLNRLRQPHSNHEDTSQSYSSFTTNYKPPQEYEPLLVAASKLRSQCVKSYERRESSEAALVQSKFSLNAYTRYIAAERRAKYPDMFVMKTLYERAIAEAAKRRFNEESGAEEALRLFWVGYCDVLRINGAGATIEHDILQRAVRSVPASGEIWARYLRYLERIADTDDVAEARESVAEIYAKALSTNLIQAEVEQIVPLTLARAGYEKRQIEAGKADEEAFATLMQVLDSGIQMVRSVSATPIGDPRLRLEKYVTDIYLRLASLPEGAMNIWQLTAKHYKTSYLAWISYTDVLIKQDRHDQARAVFKDLCMKNVDWPEAIWEAWVSFEHLYGSVEEVDACLDKIEKAQYQVNARRAREAEKASHQMVQVTDEHQEPNVLVAGTIPSDPGEAASAMNTDLPQTIGESGTKRKAEDTSSPDERKKARIVGIEEHKPLPLKRDRENSTVFVADLPAGVTEEDLQALFKDCGKVREVKITELPNAVVATVEFFERDSVPAALTKDKKRLRDQEVAVHLAWKSTLYVTNFPEKADDPFMRDLFGQFGIIFDVRWPSKKFKNTRRFCYVQYTSPSAADQALELHGQELEPGQPVNVFMSNPERKKERTDADANEREIYVAGLSKFTSKSDLETLFKTYGVLKEVRMATETNGHCKGFAFVEFEQEKDATAALSANNYELKKRRIAVTLVDSRARARNRNAVSDTGLSKLAESRNRSVRVRNLPPATQEGLLQQVLEKHALIKRVEVFASQNEALVELENAVEAGKLLLRTVPILFNGNPLEILEEGLEAPRSRLVAPATTKTGGLFVPRAAVSRPRAGLGHRRKQPTRSSGNQAQAAASNAEGGRNQDDFRKMLGG